MEFQEGDIIGVFQPRSGRSILSLYFDMGAGAISYFSTDVALPGGTDAPTSVFTTTVSGVQSDNDLPLLAVEISESNLDRIL